jgi:AAA ATPase containing von Willebrand factor type A (vWA) domain
LYESIAHHSDNVHITVICFWTFHTWPTPPTNIIPPLSLDPSPSSWNYNLHTIQRTSRARNKRIYNSSNTRCIHVSCTLRGGASNSSEHDATDVEEKAPKALVRPSNLWGSISSAFQLNIDAKDELIHERYDGNDDDATATATTAATTIRSAIDGTSDGLGDENGTESFNVDTNSKNEESDLEIQDQEGQGFDNENITVEHEDVGVVEDGLGAVNDGSDELVQNIPSHDIHDTTVQEQSKNNVKEVDLEQDTEEKEDEKDNDEQEEGMREEREINVEEEYDFDANENVDHEETTMVATNVASPDDMQDTNDANLHEDDDISSESPSLEEIVREEWSMIPDTEVEDEGKEYEIKQRRRIEKSTRRKSSSSKDQSYKKSRSRGDVRMMPILDNTNGEEKDTLLYEYDGYRSTARQDGLGQRWPNKRQIQPHDEILEAEKKPMSVTNRTLIQDSPYVSSGLVSGSIQCVFVCVCICTNALVYILTTVIPT